MRMSIVSLGICATLLSSCAGYWQLEDDTVVRDTATATTAEAAVIAPRGGHSGAVQPRRSIVLASLRPDLPSTFTGCLKDDEICFVQGAPVEAKMRFEPQSARYWFLDPASGNTYYADGELRTGDLFRERQALDLAARRAAQPQTELKIDTFPLVPDTPASDDDKDRGDQDDEDNDEADESVGAATAGESL